MTDKCIAIDFETFYSDDFTLKLLTTEAYVRDKRFEVHCCGFYNPSTGDTAAEVDYGGMRTRLRMYAEQGYKFIAQNAPFDGLICSRVFGVKPVYWYDTLSMARNIRGVNVSNSLASLTEAYNLPEKIVPYNLFKGRTKIYLLASGIMSRVADGAVHDAALAGTLWNKLKPEITAKEFDLIDLTVKMFTDPVIKCNIPLLQEFHDAELARKAAILEQAGVDEAALKSDKKFYHLLLDKGVEVEMKETKAGNSKPALAKTDPFMETLLHHEDESIRVLAEARLELRTSIKTTRAARFIEAAERGPLPIALTYFGAQPGRWASWDKLNLLNLPRGSALRRSLEAPDGYHIVSVDLSGIELRVALALAGMLRELREIKNGIDPYCTTASSFYKREITKADKAERGLGKLIRLSGQYGASGASMKRTAQLGTYGPKIFLTDEEADEAKCTFRNTHVPMCHNRTGKWAECGRLLVKMAKYDEGTEEVIYPGIVADYAAKKLWLFGRYAINYSGLEYYVDDDENSSNYGETGYRQATQRTKTVVTYKRMWNTKLWQHIVQGVARIIMSDAAWRFSKLYRVVLMVHDEPVFLVPEDLDDATLQKHIELCIPKTVSYIPGLPIDFEVNRGKAYAK